MTDAYAALSLHRWMLQDEIRNESYRIAIERAVKPGDVVLDMGSGTGILSLFAARAGAKRVFAVERTDIAAVARRMVRKNGFEDRIEVLHANLEDVDLPEKVDVLISEWMGGLGVDENMLAPLLIARERWLKKGGKIVPERVTAFMAPAYIPGFDEAFVRWSSKPHGVDLSVISEITSNETVMAQHCLSTNDMRSEPQSMWLHDAYTCTLAEADRPFETKLRFTLRAGKVSALATWFVADMGGGEALTNAVDAPTTHWGQMLFPLDRTVEAREGASMEVELRCEPSAPGTCEFYWSARIDDGPVEEHDTRRTSRLFRDELYAAETPAARP